MSHEERRDAALVGRIERAIKDGVGAPIALRDRFALVALQGLLANGVTAENEADWLEVTPRLAYAMADAMLAERAKGAVPRG